MKYNKYILAGLFSCIAVVSALGADAPQSKLGTVDCGNGWTYPPQKERPDCHAITCNLDSDCPSHEGPGGYLIYSCLSDVHLCGWQQLHPNQ